MVTPVPTARSETKSFGTRFGLGVGVLGVLLGLVIAGLTWWQQHRPSTRVGQIRSLAVLPFDFETKDPNLSGLGKWIPAEIRSKLGPLQNLQVVNSPARIAQLVQQKKSEVEIARELSVDGLVMGELHGQGEMMSAYVWVVDGATGRALGKQREIASSASKVSELPNQVALAIVDELKLQVSTSQRTEIQVAETQNAEAFLAYQKSQELLSSRLFDQAAIELRRAYQLDTNYTRAWSALAATEWVPFIYGGTTNEMTATFKRLSVEGERLHAQRPDDQALVALRMILAMAYERDWNKVNTLFWDIQRNHEPDGAVLHDMSFYYTFIEGHPELALRARRQAIALDPEVLFRQIDLGNLLFFFGRYDDAVRAFRSLQPEKIQLEDYSVVLLMAGDLAGAKEVATRVLAGRPNAMTRCNLAAIEAKSGAGEEAQRILAGLEADAEKGLHIPYAQIAWSYGVLGDFESARRWLQKGLIEGHGDWSMLSLRSADKLELFGKLAWYWEIIDEMNFPPLQMDNPFFALEQAMRYGRGTVGPATTSTSNNEPPKTLAVLPFVNLSADKSDEYLSLRDGMAEELINALGGVPGLRVPGRSSSFAFRDISDENLFKKVGDQLKVSTVLEGSVRKAGDQIRVIARLINVADGFQIWSATYDRPLTNILALEGEIATQVAEALKIRLGLEETRALAKMPTENPEAHRLYLLGCYHFNKFTQAGLALAMDYFNQALQLDPKYALAHCGLADCYGWIGCSLIPGREAWAKSKELAQRALALDPNLPEAHLSLGTALWNDFDWNGGEQAIKRALELNPRLDTAYDQLAYLQGLFGRFDEAIRNQKRAIEVDPRSLIFNSNLAWLLKEARRYDESIAQALGTLELDPNFAQAHLELGWSLLMKGDRPGAIAAFQQAKALDFQPWIYVGLIYAYALNEDRAKAEQALRDWEEQAKDRYLSPAPPMLFHLGLGENEKALDWLEKCYMERDVFCWFLKVDPFYDSLRTEPRFQAVLKKVFPEP